LKGFACNLGWLGLVWEKVFRILIVDFKISKLIWIPIISVVWIQGSAASATNAQFSAVGQQIFSTPTVLACGGGGSDSERRPKRPGHQQKTTTSVPTAPAEVKP